MAQERDLGNAGVDDMFEMAAIVEQQGSDFYERLRAETADPHVKKELEYLRDEEAAHKRYFLDQMKGMGRRPSGSVTPGLQAFLDREFITPLQELYSSAGIMDNRTALRFGVKLEEKSISFYKDMKSAAEESKKADIERIIAEEEGHRKKLQLMLAHF